MKGKETFATFIYLLFVLSLMCTALPVFAGGSQDTEIGESSYGPPNISDLNPLQIIQNAFREVAKKVIPVVVEIDTVDVIRGSYPSIESPFDFFFGPREGIPRQEREFRRWGLGSGVIVKTTGKQVYVLTNNHVVGEAEEISVRLHDKRQFKATLVGKDPRKDLALVVFETDESIPVAVLGDSDLVQVGDLVFAVGNPLGFESSITMGIVSAVGRKPLTGSQIAGFTDYIQTDAAINQGNSGGPLVNIKGEVIGINTWISSPTGGSIGLGFTIPVNNAKTAVEDFISKGKIDYGWLGINVGDPSSELKKDMEIADIYGAFVYDVFKDSPADRDGLLPGDFITHINGEKIQDRSSLVFAVGDLPIGRIAEFEIVRYAENMTLEVKISERKEEREIEKEKKSIWPGMSVLHITEDIQKQLNLPRKMGEIIVGNVSPGTTASTAGFRPADVIKEINGKTVKNVMDFYRAINGKVSREVVFRIYREGNELTISLPNK